MSISSGMCGAGGNICRGIMTSPTSIASANTGGGQSHDHTLSANFSGSANSVLQPYLVLIYIIKT
jgi:hypothetical protein